MKNDGRATPRQIKKMRPGQLALLTCPTCKVVYVNMAAARTCRVLHR